MSGAPGRWKHRVPLPRWSPGALTDGVNGAKLVLGVWKAGPRCMERVEVDGKRRKKGGEGLLGQQGAGMCGYDKAGRSVVKVRLRGADKADKGLKLRTLLCLVPKGKRR